MTVSSTPPAAESTKPVERLAVSVRAARSYSSIQLGEHNRGARQAWGVVGCQVLLLVAILVTWEIASTQGWISVHLFSRPSDVWSALAELYREDVLIKNTVATYAAAGTALLIAVPSGILAGLLLAAFPFMDRVVWPFLVPINSLPRIALAPLLLIWFGLTMSAKVALAVSIVFFIVLFNTRAGTKSVDPDMLAVADLLGVPRRGVFLKVVCPTAVPAILASARLAVTYSLLGVIASEMVAAKDGLGVVVVRYSNLLDISGVFAILLVLAFFAVILGQILDRVERRLLRWQ